MGTTLDHKIDDIANGGKNFGWVKTYALLPEGRAGLTTRGKLGRKNEPCNIVLPHVNIVLEGDDEGHEGKSFEKRAHQEKG